MNIASTLARGFFCWVCPLVFTVPTAKGEKVCCPQCHTVVALPDSPQWPEHQAWCSSCRMFYGTTWMKGLKPQCLRCSMHCDGTNPDNAMREIQKDEDKKSQMGDLHAWSEKNFPDLIARGFRSDEMADRFLFTVTRSQPALLDRDTVEQYFHALVA